VNLGLPEGQRLRPEYELSAPAVHAMMKANPASVLLIDVRTKAEWDFAHVEGSVHIPLDEIERRADEAHPEPGQTVCCLCHHGVRSLKASLALRHLGIAGAMSVAGGIEAWSLAADPSVPRYVRDGGRCVQA
jgi:rhodanese-related sulfurtransferase